MTQLLWRTHRAQPELRTCVNLLEGQIPLLSLNLRLLVPLVVESLGCCIRLMEQLSLPRVAL
jgi:hypothetical protein